MRDMGMRPIIIGNINVIAPQDLDHSLAIELRRGGDVMLLETAGETLALAAVLRQKGKEQAELERAAREMSRASLYGRRR